MQKLPYLAFLILVTLPLAAPAQAAMPVPAASAPIEVVIRREPENSWLQPSTFIGVLGGVGGLAALLLQRYWHRRDEADARKRADERVEQDRRWLQETADRDRKLQSEQTERDRLLVHALDSLKWFEGKSQKRSIGISAVEGYWEHLPMLHDTWVGVLLNQALYLLVESEQGDAAHERANLVRIIRLLGRPQVTLRADQRNELRAAITQNRKGKGVRGIDEEQYKVWEASLSAA